MTAEKKSTAHECGRCGRRWHGGHDHCCDCHERELADLRASLLREQNSQKVLARENDRLRAELIPLRGAYAITSGAKP
jgi:hypothetical protein